MNRLLILVLLVIVCAVGAGFYFGYLKIASENSDGTSHITLTVEQKKMQEDEKNAEEKIRGKKEAAPKS